MSMTKESKTGTLLTADSRWQIIETGGGCQALARNVNEPAGKPDDWYWLITNDAAAPESMEEECVLGLYDASELIGTWMCSNVWAALAIANGMQS